MTCPLTVQVTPTVLSVSATPPAPLTINVTSTAPVSVGVTAPALSLSLVETPISVTVSTVGAPGPPGPPGPSGSGGASTLDAITAEAISGHFVVTVNNSGLMDYASANHLTHANQPLALTTGAWGSGVLATAVLVGPVNEPSWSWSPGLPIFLGDNGLPTQTLPNDALFQRQVAEVINSTTIMFNPQLAIVLS